MNQEIQSISIKDLYESPQNPRKVFSVKGMEELIQSIRKSGVLVPLLVRPDIDEQRFEILCGARRFRAAAAVGLFEIPAIVKEMKDSAALEIMIVENLQREDVHPLEEAEGFSALLQTPGQSVQKIAAKIGKSDAYVYQRLKLADLIPALKTQYYAERIAAGHALLLARLQPADQEKALEELFVDRFGWSGNHSMQAIGDRQVRSVRNLAEWIEQHIYLDLHAAAFKKHDENLLADTPSCIDCPKRSGFSPALFDDIKKDSICTDPTCFHAKQQAALQIAVDKLQKSQKNKVLLLTDAYSAEKGSELLARSSYHEIDSKDDQCTSMQKAIMAAGSAKEIGKVHTICCDPDCGMHGKKAISRSGTGSPEDKAKQKKEEEKLSIAKTARIRTLMQCAALGQCPLDAPLLRIIAASFFSGLWHEAKKALIARHDLMPEKNSASSGSGFEEIFQKHIAELDPRALAGILIELAGARHIDSNGYGDQASAIDAIAAVMEVDKKAIFQSVVAEFKLKAKEKEKKGKGKKA